MNWFFDFDKIPLRDKIRNEVVQIALSSDNYNPDDLSLRKLVNEKRELAKTFHGVTLLFYNCDINPSLSSFLQYHSITLRTGKYCALKLRLQNSVYYGREVIP